MTDAKYGSGGTASRAPRAVSLKQMLMWMLLGIAVSMTALAFCIQRLGVATNDVAKAHEVRYTSYLLADELRQSSDDLTRLARTYVVSGDPQWKEQYQEVLDIRAGKRARPAQYHKIYWDFRAAGIHPRRGEDPAAALTDLMRRAGFTADEFAKLNESERNSNDLVRTETLAMNMVAGQSSATAGAANSTSAQALMHDADYHRFKSKIMQPLDEFFSAVDLRTQQSIAAAEQNKKFWHTLLITIAAVLVVLLFGSLWLAYRQLARSLDEAVRVADAIASGTLDIDVKPEGPREVASLLNAMSRMRMQLVGVVSNVRQNAETVATACAHIAQGNSDLSGRTQEQASALQESAASMEQLSATVQRNADNAAQANELSRGASLVATRGGEVVGKVSFTGELKPEDIQADEIPLWERPLVRDIAKLLAGLIVLLALVFTVLRPLVKGLLAAPRVAYTPAALPGAAAGEDIAIANGQRAAVKLDYEGQIAQARGLVNQDAARVAQVVKTWVGNDE